MVAAAVALLIFMARPASAQEADPSTAAPAPAQQTDDNHQATVNRDGDPVADDAASDPVPAGAPPTSDVSPASDDAAPAGDSAAPSDDTPPADDAAAPTTVSAGPAGDDTASAAEDSDPTTAGTDPSTGTADQLTQEAEVDVTGTAVANTGGNGVLEPPGGSTATGTAGRGVATAQTGSSAAVGSEAQTSIGQQAQITESDPSALVIVDQVSIVVNIGIGVANSGANGVDGDSVAVGPVATGGANAVGNSSITLVLQGTSLDDGKQTYQLAIVTTSGDAVANSGGNTAAPLGGTPVGAGGEVVSGSAQAIGNRSTTTTLQTVVVTISGPGSVAIQQRIVIVNIGFAVANSGVNGSSGLTAEQASLIQAILEALLPSFGSAALPGSVPSTSAGVIATTGPASAVGNDSQTGVAQQVVATLSGGGTASARQDVYIANIGSGVANTGVNPGAVALDPALQSMIDSLRVGIEQLLGLAGSAGLTQGDASLQATADLGSLLLQVRGDLTATMTAVGVDGQAAPSTATSGIRLRQVSVVLDIGIAAADSGHNAAGVSTARGTPVGISEADPAGESAVDATTLQALGAVLIRTGDAVAIGNRSVVLVCQLDGLQIPCPTLGVAPAAASSADAPEAVETDAAVVAPVAVVLTDPSGDPADGSGTLPMTGTDLSTLVAVGVALLGAGEALRRRGRTATDN
jgi:hypothetical protein